MAGRRTLKPPADDPAERRLIEAAQRDAACFARLYEDNFERVYAFVARRVRDRDQAQDLTADVFRSALENLPRFKWSGAPFAAWLFRIAANAIADRGKRAAQLEKANALRIDDSDPAGDIDLAEAEHRARLFRLVGALPGDQRRVIVMRFAQRKSIAEIARDLARSEGAIKQLQFRGLQSLRAMVVER